MQMFFFLVVAVVLIYALSTLLFPPQAEEEEEELWDAAELRLESLLQGMMDPREEIRTRYSNRILAMGPSVIPRLTESLSQELFLDQNPVRIERLKTLILDYGLRSVPALLHMLEEEGGDPAVTSAVKELLLTLGPSSLPQIVDRLGFPIVVPLLGVLQTWGNSSVKAALKGVRKRPSERFWQRVFLALGPDAIPQVEEALNTWRPPAKDAAFRIYAAFSPEAGRQRFIEAARAKDASIRGSALRALGRLAHPEDFPLLKDALRDEEAEIRLDVIQVLPGFGTALALPELRALVEELEGQEHHLESRLTAIRALTQLDEIPTLAQVELGLGASTWRLRAIGLQLLSHLPANEQIELYERLLWDVDERMVHDVILSLGSMASAASVRVLLRFAIDSHCTDETNSLLEEALLGMKTDEAMEELAASLKESALSESGLALRVLLQTDEPGYLDEVLVCLQTADDPDATWGIEPEDLHMYLQRVSTRCDLHVALERFLTQHETSPLAPAIRSFLAQLPKRLAPKNLDPSTSPDS